MWGLAGVGVLEMVVSTWMFASPLWTWPLPPHSQWLRKRGLVGNFLTPLVGMGSRP